MKTLLTVEFDMEINKEEYPELTEKQVLDGIVLYDDDVVDGLVLSTSINGYDNTNDFFLKNAKIVKKELASETTITAERKNELYENMIAWICEHIPDDKDLFYTLNHHFGMTKEELHEHSIESLDRFFDEADLSENQTIEQSM